MPAPSPGRSSSSSNNSCVFSSFGSDISCSDLDLDSLKGVGSSFNLDIGSCDSCDINIGIFCFGQDMVLEGFGILLVLGAHNVHILVLSIFLKDTFSDVLLTLRMKVTLVPRNLKIS